MGSSLPMGFEASPARGCGHPCSGYHEEAAGRHAKFSPSSDGLCVVNRICLSLGGARQAAPARCMPSGWERIYVLDGKEPRGCLAHDEREEQQVKTLHSRFVRLGRGRRDPGAESTVRVANYRGRFRRGTSQEGEVVAAQSIPRFPPSTRMEEQSFPRIPSGEFALSNVRKRADLWRINNEVSQRTLAILPIANSDREEFKNDARDAR